MIKKITGTRGYIDVEFEDRIIRIDGELTFTPEFYAVKSTMKDLNQPGLRLLDTEKDQLVTEILAYNENQYVKIIFED